MESDGQVHPVIIGVEQQEEHKARPGEIKAIFPVVPWEPAFAVAARSV